ncbi:MAG: sulfate ABC transporter permease subunit CysT [Thermoleophilia bacterium]
MAVRDRAGRLGAPLGIGVAVIYMSVIVLIPFAALVSGAFENGWSTFWDAISSSQATSALSLTVTVSLVVVGINIVMGTLIAWILVRDQFPGKAIVNSLIDLPFALPTIVAGVTLLAIYGPSSPFGVNVAFTRTGIVVALLLVTLPFVVRAVQPVLLEIDREMEQAAASLGAGRWTIFRRIIFPNLLPAILGGSGLAFSRALGEFGSLVLIAGNIPFDTQVSSLYIINLIEGNQGGTPVAAAAVSVSLLVLSLAALLLLSGLERWSSRHAR